MEEGRGVGCIMIEPGVAECLISAFGNAYLALHVKSGQQYVIKKIELGGKTEQQRENIFNEVKLLEEFKHFNIVSYRQSIIEGQELNIIMEFCYGGDLNQLIQEHKENEGGKKLDEKKIVDWAAQISLAIFYMHDKRILHRDLKTPNIFIVDSTVKLGDFGISKVLDEKVDLASTSIGTPYYMSPQQYRHKPYSYKSDIWAFGCILYQMCNQKRPFEAYSLNGLAVKVLEAHFAPVSEFYSRELRELINRMLQKKEKDRPSILEFLQTPIIKRRAAAYLKETYQRLIKQDGDKVLIEGVLYQSKKLGIPLQLQEKKEQGQQKKVKPEFSAEKKRQQKERIRLQLEQELRKISEKDKQQKEQLKKLTEDRKIFLKRSKKDDKVSHYGRKPAFSKSSSKQHSTSASDSRVMSAQSVRSKEKEEKPKHFEIKQKYDMYEMEYEEQQESQGEVETITEVEEEQEHKPYEKEKYSKVKEAKQQKEVKDAKQVREVKEAKDVKQVKQARDAKQVKEAKDVKQLKQVKEAKQARELKEVKSQAARFTQLAPPVSSSKIEPQVPIEETIINLKQSIKMNMEIVNTIKNELSNIDFSISSSEDQLEQTIEPQKMPVMKRKDKNPVHVALSDKSNDLRQTLESILSKELVERVVGLAKARGCQVSKGEVEKVVGNRQGTYHLALELVKLTTMLQRIPLYS